MLAQRSLQHSMRRLAAQQPGLRIGTTSFAAPAAIATSRAATQWRQVASASVSNNDILVAQRKNRPVSPHLGIYQPQITWVASGLNRITGVALSGGFYAFMIAYLAAPAFGWHLESASMAAAFAAWPLAVKLFTKSLVALPFTFHSVNGLRHLGWDLGFGFKKQTVKQTGWIGVGISVVGAAWMAFFL